MNYWRQIDSIQKYLDSLNDVDREKAFIELSKNYPTLGNELLSNPYHIIDGRIGGLREKQDFDYFFENGYDKILFLGGRATGKTSSSCQYVKIWVDTYAKEGDLCLYVGPTHQHWEIIKNSNDGVIKSFPEHRRPKQFGNGAQIRFHNGAILRYISAEAYDRVRSNNARLVIYDEMCIYDANKIEDIHKTISAAIRSKSSDGRNTKELIVSTPRAIKYVGKLISDPTYKYIKDSSRSNIHNLSDNFIKNIYDMYGDTALGRQELEGEFIWDDSIYLFEEKNIIYDCLNVNDTSPGVCIALDPAVTSNKQSDESGLIVCKSVIRDGKQCSLVMEDASGRYTPLQLREKIKELIRKYGSAYLTCEVNQGGDFIHNYLKDDYELRKLGIESFHAKKSKFVRGEIIAPLFEQKRILFNSNMVKGHFDDLIKQITEFNKISEMPHDDRLDSWVYANISVFGLEKLLNTSENILNFGT